MKPSQKGIPKKQYTLVQRAIMVHHWSRKSRNVRKATFLANNPDVDEEKLGAWCREVGVNSFLQQLLNDQSINKPLFEEKTIQWIDEKGSIICLDNITKEYRMTYCLTDDVRFTKKNEGLSQLKRSSGLVTPQPMNNSVKLKQSLDKNFFLPRTKKKQKVALVDIDSDTELEKSEKPKMNEQVQQPTPTSSTASEVTMTATNMDAIVDDYEEYIEDVNEQYVEDEVHEENVEEKLLHNSSLDEIGN